MSCIHYKHSLLEFLVPSYKIIYKFCSSTEKTVIFFISLIRLCIFYRLFTYFNNNKMLSPLMYYVYLFYLMFNVFYIIIVLFKEPDYDQVEMEREVSDIVVALEQNNVNA